MTSINAISVLLLIAFSLVGFSEEPNANAQVPITEVSFKAYCIHSQTKQLDPSCEVETGKATFADNGK